MRLALFGGSFDPVHIGHLFVADEVIRTGEFDAVVFVPASNSPLKDDRPRAKDADRLAMLDLAVRGREGLSFDSWEIERGGVSYTRDTVEHLYASVQVAGTLGLVIGADLTGRFGEWRHSDEILRRTRPVVVERPGFPVDEGFSRESQRFDAERGASMLRIDNRIMAVSSSDIRERVPAGRAFRDLVPAGVYDYIVDRALYGHA